MSIICLSTKLLLQSSCMSTWFVTTHLEQYILKLTAGTCLQLDLDCFSSTNGSTNLFPRKGLVFMKKHTQLLWFFTSWFNRQNLLMVALKILLMMTLTVDSDGYKINWFVENHISCLSRLHCISSVVWAPQLIWFHVFLYLKHKLMCRLVLFFQMYSGIFRVHMKYKPLDEFIYTIHDWC